MGGRKKRFSFQRIVQRLTNLNSGQARGPTSSLEPVIAARHSAADFSTSPDGGSECTDTMTEEIKEDFSALPITDRWVHKIWKVRKQAYEETAKAFETTPDESHPAFKPFLQDPSLWKSAAADSNVAAQQDGLAALCAFLKLGPREGCLRSRQHTISVIVEKGLPSAKAGTKASSLEALLLYAEVDVPGPVIEEILPSLGNKQPKVVAAALAALTQIFHNYGCKTADPKPVLKILPKPFGHADKNVRSEASKLAVELYRWLREAMKPMFWNDLKPSQQTELEAQFEKIGAEPNPKQERLLRSQQAAKANAPVGTGEEQAEEDDVEEEAEIEAFDLAEPQDVMGNMPKDFYDNLGSSKWKERKEALEALYAIVNVPRIKDGDFGEVNRSLAKCMKDANIAVVTQAAQCIELLATGLRRSYGKYRSTVMQPILERMKEKKVTVADALGAALDAVFLSTSLGECLEDMTTYLVHKNPQIKEGTMKFLIRCLRTTREVPTKTEMASIVESAKKLVTESSEGLRSGGAEILGTVMKMIGERAMAAHLEGLDEIRKGKVKEYYETAEVKAKEKPKPKPPPPAARPTPGVGKKMVKKSATAVKKSAATSAPPAESGDLVLSGPRQTGLARPTGASGSKGPPKKVLSPRRAAASPPLEEEPPTSPPQAKPASRLGLGKGSLAGRSLAKPSSASSTPSAPAVSTSSTATSGLTAIERAELEELRDANERLHKQLEDARHDRSKLYSEIQELKNLKAELIEGRKRDVLSIKAKETQLVRARGDVETAEATNERLRRELERLKRALGKAEQLGLGSGSPDSASVGHSGLTSPTYEESGQYRDQYRDNGFLSGSSRKRISHAESLGEDKDSGDGAAFRNKFSPDLRGGSAISNGRGSPVRGSRRDTPADSAASEFASLPAMHADRSNSRTGSHISDATASSGTQAGVESWKRAAEVTSQLKARIEQMKARQAMNR